MSHRPERGAGSVLVLGAAAALVAVLGAVLLVIGVVRDLHRARAAADLAALAAAGPTVAGAPADCAAAARVAAGMTTVLADCRTLADGSALVEVRVPAGWPAGWSGPLGCRCATARAGPRPGPSS